MSRSDFNSHDKRRQLTKAVRGSANGGGVSGDDPGGADRKRPGPNSNAV